MARARAGASGLNDEDEAVALSRGADFAAAIFTDEKIGVVEKAGIR
jgi:hypothetical protein